MAELKKWLKEVVFRATQQPKGQIFEIKMLFTGTEWNKLSVGEKRQLGSLFSNELKEGNIPDIIRVENNKQHHNVYQKI